MTLAVVLGICLLCPSAAHGVAVSEGQQAPSSATAQATGAQSKPASGTQSAGPSTSQGRTGANPSKPVSTKPRGHRKVASPNCVDTTSGNKRAAGSASSSPASTSRRLKPCPPEKTVVRNGGTNAPPVRLTGTDPTKPVSRSTTDELLAATEANLKKIAGRELKPDQQQTLAQIREFMEQSRQAAASGDLERGQNLASKARLLSDDLAKP